MKLKTIHYIAKGTFCPKYYCIIKQFPLRVRKETLQVLGLKQPKGCPESLNR